MSYYIPGGGDTFANHNTWLIAVVTISGLSGIAMNSVAGTLPFVLGFGALQLQILMTGWAVERIASLSKRIVATVSIANSPQAIFSFLYLSFSGLLTLMFLANEWNYYAEERKTLRVSLPRRGQRST